MTPRVSVVLASIDSAGTMPESVRGFLREVGPRGEVIVVDSSRDGSHAVAGMFPSRVRLIRREPGRLAPELWATGLDCCDADIVAFSTCQMVPRPGWLASIRRALAGTDASGVGGPIAPGAKLNSTDRALYLLRFAGYLPPLPNVAQFDPPGDNAAYRRDRLAGLEDAWSGGFWEVAIHQRMRLREQTLATAPEAIVEFRGGSKLASALSHRLAHARNFGAGRSRGKGVVHKVVRTAAGPAVPPLLMARIARNLVSRGVPVGPWLRSAPRLALLLSAWSLGEAAGAWLGPGDRSRAA